MPVQLVGIFGAGPTVCHGQPFEARAGKRPYGLLEQPRFRAGYDFLLLRAESGEIDLELGEWWTRFQDADGEERAQMLLPEQGGDKKRRRRRKKPASDSVDRNSPE